MKNMWRDEGRRGQPHESSTDTQKSHPPAGFEGMNYEQKRSPYREGENEEKRVNGQGDTDRRGGENDL